MGLSRKACINLQWLDNLDRSAVCSNQTTKYQLQFPTLKQQGYSTQIQVFLYKIAFLWSWYCRLYLLKIHYLVCLESTKIQINKKTLPPFFIFVNSGRASQKPRRRNAPTNEIIVISLCPNHNKFICRLIPFLYSIFLEIVYHWIQTSKSLILL